MSTHGDVCTVFSVKPRPCLRTASGTPARFARIPRRNDLMSSPKDTGIPTSLRRIAAWTKFPGLQPAHVPRGPPHEDVGPLHWRRAQGHPRRVPADALSTSSTYLPGDRGHYRCACPTIAGPLRACVATDLVGYRYSSCWPLIHARALGVIAHLTVSNGPWPHGTRHAQRTATLGKEQNTCQTLDTLSAGLARLATPGQDIETPAPALRRLAVVSVRR